MLAAFLPELWPTPLPAGTALWPGLRLPYGGSWPAGRYLYPRAAKSDATLLLPSSFAHSSSFGLAPQSCGALLLCPSDGPRGAESTLGRHPVGYESW